VLPTPGRDLPQSTEPEPAHHDRLNQYQKTKRHSRSGWCFSTNQENRKMPKRSLSRRTLLAAAASLPAAAAADNPALADPTNPDAELLRLGPKLELLLAEWHAQRAKDERRIEAYDRACEAAGFPDVALGSVPIEEWRDCQKRRDAAVPFPLDESGLAKNGESNAWNNIHGRLFPLTDEILSFRPKTMAGLAVFARAASVENLDYWAEGTENEMEGERSFLEAICAFAGVEPVAIEKHDAFMSGIGRVADDTLTRIADHRRLQLEFDEIVKRLNYLEGELPHDRCKSFRITDRGTDAGKDDDPSWTAMQDEYWAVEDRIDEIAWSFVDRPPTTNVGWKALLKYAAEYEDAGHGWPDCRHHLENGVYIGQTVEDWRSGLMRAAEARLVA
jgi:hypothetical protein